MSDTIDTQQAYRHESDEADQHTDQQATESSDSDSDKEEPEDQEPEASSDLIVSLTEQDLVVFVVLLWLTLVQKEQSGCRDLNKATSLEIVFTRMNRIDNLNLCPNLRDLTCLL